ncbi:hypothetical protein [Blastochloris sulfoviridis]|uniref:Uncharacterized protein n=1 Tax=Blastochloris sulfoviridis TaxID=50712 RepID=A0A5M6I652_9HYPH|nr:hypothetical protein [Blastochloris sulfoviridis]KAA5603642.1 hypothetical protein F1193_00680 [Blastochloris sulfoviridis]
MMRLVAGLAFGCVLSVLTMAEVSAAAQGGKKAVLPGTPMTGAEIRAFAIGVPLESLGPDGSRAIIRHKADGTSVYELIRGEKRARINGIWTMRGNQFCRRFSRPKETETCLDYRRISDTTAAIYSGRKLVARQHRQP